MIVEVARWEPAKDSTNLTEVVVKVVNQAEITREVLWLAQASKELAHAELDFWWSKSARISDFKPSPDAKR
jgi:hypothetical protein